MIDNARDRRRVAACVWVVVLSAGSLSAQSRNTGQSGPRKLLPRGEEIALARSAAPAQVSSDATVWVFTDSGYVIGESGSNGVACYVGRSWQESVEPHCFDTEGAATILPIEMRTVELYHRGRSPEQVEREIAVELASGRLRTPRRPALTWMQSGAQQLIRDDGKPVGRWQPHLMIYYPYLTGAELGLGSVSDLKGAVLVDGGTPTSNLMIVTREFVQPELPAAPAR
ncbi:MAG TPA: hypothetical protein VHJ69_01820 [Gemmatimonadales bacterium]|nr:hypothetical protein [Gemmatimonadales bacterium]